MKCTRKKNLNLNWNAEIPFIRIDALAYKKNGCRSLQIEGGECQLDSLSYWHDDGGGACIVRFAVVAGEVGGLDSTGARWRGISAHTIAGFASSANEIHRRVDSRDKRDKTK
jgi:hypothetical protein